MIGTYVTYKNSPWLVVRETDGLVLLLRPGNTKRQVSRRSVQATNLRPATQVEWQEAQYLVTGKGMIVSCKTGRAMQWEKNHGGRRAILDMAGVSEPVSRAPATPSYKGNPLSGMTGAQMREHHRVVNNLYDPFR